MGQEYTFKNRNTNKKIENKDREFNSNTNKKSKCPIIFRVNEVDWSSMSFEEKMQYFLIESNEIQKAIKGKNEFVSNNDKDKIALRKAKKRIAIDKRRGF